jgi:hypothetical protein
VRHHPDPRRVRAVSTARPRVTDTVGLPVWGRLYAFRITRIALHCSARQCMLRFTRDGARRFDVFRWEYQKTTFPKLSDRGQAEAAVVDLDVTVEFSIVSDHTTTPHHTTPHHLRSAVSVFSWR